MDIKLTYQELDTLLDALICLKAQTNLNYDELYSKIFILRNIEEERME